MSDIKLFKIQDDAVIEIPSESVAVERTLQRLIEKHLEDFFGIRFLGSEFSTGKKHGGRIDTIGIDENNCPVIIEYKRAINQNVISQGLYYLDWLMDHLSDFRLLVMAKFGNENSDKIDFTSPRLLCIAKDFTKYDLHAISQIDRNIELIRYCYYGGDLLLLELVNSVTADPIVDIEIEDTTVNIAAAKKAGNHIYRTVEEMLEGAPQNLKDLFDSAKEMLISMGDDVQVKALKFYFAFKRIRNFACIELRVQQGYLLITVNVCPDSVDMIQGFTRDVRGIGHLGTGNLEIHIRSIEDLEKARPLFEISYNNS